MNWKTGIKLGRVRPWVGSFKALRATEAREGGFGLGSERAERRVGNVAPGRSGERRTLKETGRASVSPPAPSWLWPCPSHLPAGTPVTLTAGGGDCGEML